MDYSDCTCSIGQPHKDVFLSRLDTVLTDHLESLANAPPKSSPARVGAPLATPEQMSRELDRHTILERAMADVESRMPAHTAAIDTSLRTLLDAARKVRPASAKPVPNGIGATPTTASPRRSRFDLNPDQEAERRREHARMAREDADPRSAMESPKPSVTAEAPGAASDPATVAETAVAHPEVPTQPIESEPADLPSAGVESNAQAETAVVAPEASLAQVPDAVMVVAPTLEPAAVDAPVEPVETGTASDVPAAAPDAPSGPAPMDVAERPAPSRDPSSSPLSSVDDD